MAHTQEIEPRASSAIHVRNMLNAIVGKEVMRLLGEPDDLLLVQVRPLWDFYYRVNVFVGTSTVVAKIAKSYFVQTDREGEIVSSSPEILKQFDNAGHSCAHATFGNTIAPAVAPSGVRSLHDQAGTPEHPD